MKFQNNRKIQLEIRQNVLMITKLDTVRVSTSRIYNLHVKSIPIIIIDQKLEKPS